MASFVESFMVLGLLVLSTPVDAHFLPGASRSVEGWQMDPLNYLAPNEHFPQEAATLLDGSDPGVYVAVGTERGFIHFAQSRADRLLLVDRSPGVVLFNRMNIALLALAESREDYVWLRLSASADAIAHRLRASNLSPAQKLILQGSTWKWWEEEVRERSGPSGQTRFHLFHSNSELSGSGAFRGVNYLFNDRLFRKLSEAAKENRLQAEKVNLSRIEEVEEIVSALRFEGFMISVLDLSNAWEPQHISPKDFDAMKAVFSQVTTEAAFLMTTSEKPGHGWAYHRGSIHPCAVSLESLANLAFY